MKHIHKVQAVKPSTLWPSLAVLVCLGLAAPIVSAQTAQNPPVRTSTPQVTGVVVTQPAEKCSSDLQDFNRVMQKDGYWLRGSGYGYGYPIYGYGYGYGYAGLGAIGTGAVPTAIGHGRMRPGYEIRTLIASANILAQSGQQQSCDAVLVAARDLYKVYAADLAKNGVPKSDSTGWRHQQIAAAQPIDGTKTPYRTDQLIGADVVNPKGVDLGSVDDIVVDPQTGKFAYLVIGRGGFFGFGEKYVPVPWGHFKAAPGANLLVLDITKSSLDGAPRVKSSNSSTAYDNFRDQSQKVDDYWKAHVMK